MVVIWDSRVSVSIMVWLTELMKGRATQRLNPKDPANAISRVSRSRSPCLMSSKTQLSSLATRLTTDSSCPAMVLLHKAPAWLSINTKSSSSFRRQEPSWKFVRKMRAGPGRTHSCLLMRKMETLLKPVRLHWVCTGTINQQLPLWPLLKKRLSNLPLCQRQSHLTNRRSTARREPYLAPVSIISSWILRTDWSGGC